MKQEITVNKIEDYEPQIGDTVTLADGTVVEWEDDRRHHFKPTFRAYVHALGKVEREVPDPEPPEGYERFTPYQGQILPSGSKYWAKAAPSEWIDLGHAWAVRAEPDRFLYAFPTPKPPKGYERLEVAEGDPLPEGTVYWMWSDPQWGWMKLNRWPDVAHPKDYIYAVPIPRNQLIASD